MDLQLVTLESPADQPVAAIAARVAGNTVGLALADVTGASAHVRSFFVEPDHWRKGIGTKLLAAIEDRARTLGAKKIEAMFDAAGGTGAIAARLGEKRGFKPSQPSTYVCRASAGRMLAAPFLDRVMPEGFEVFMWRDLKPEDERSIRERHEYSEALSPFAGPTYEPTNSLGLRKDGLVVGWMITHRMGPALVRYTSLFVREADRGSGMALLAASIQKAVEAGLVEGIFGVNLANSDMVPKLAKHLRPYLDEFREIAYIAKQL